MSIFKGAGVAIVTPMKNNEEVNYDRLEQMIEYQINQGTDCIIIAGTTGESSTLTTEEHAEVIKAAVKFAKHRIPVVAGTGSNCTREAIHLSEEAEKAGVDGLLCVTPYYNKATQGGLIRYYTEIANSVKLPIIMYNVPTVPDAISFRRQLQNCTMMLKTSLRSKRQPEMLHRQQRPCI